MNAKHVNSALSDIRVCHEKVKKSEIPTLCIMVELKLKQAHIYITMKKWLIPGSQILIWSKCLLKKEKVVRIVYFHNSQQRNSTVMPTKSDSDEILGLQLLSKTRMPTLHLS